MTQEVNTRPLPPTAAKTPPAAAAAPSFMDRVDAALEALWHFLSSMRVAMVIMLVIAFMGLLGSLIVQAPNGTMADAALKAQWFDEIRQMPVPVLGWMASWPVVGAVVPNLKYGDVLGLFDTLQLFQVFSSVVFRILVAALTISLIACSIHRIPGMIKTSTKPRVDVGPQFFEHAPQHEAIVARVPAAEAQATVEGVLRAHHYRTLTLDDGTVHIYADRFRWLTWSGLIAHLAIVAILAGAIIGGTFGFRNSSFIVPEGETKAVASEPGLALKVLDFTDSYDLETGQVVDYVSKAVLIKDGQEIEQHDIRVNDPLRYNDTTFYQSGFGEAAAIAVKDAAGATILQGGVPLFGQANGSPAGSISVPGSDTYLVVWATSGGDDPRVHAGQILAQVYKSGTDTLLAEQVIDQGKEATVGPLAITFVREQQFTSLSVARDPGVGLVWIGALLLVGGFAIRFMFPHKRLWGRISARGSNSVIQMATLSQKDVAQGTEFDNLVTDIRTALQAPAKA